MLHFSGNVMQLENDYVKLGYYFYYIITWYQVEIFSIFHLSIILYIYIFLNNSLLIPLMCVSQVIYHRLRVVRVNPNSKVLGHKTLQSFWEQRIWGNNSLQVHQHCVYWANLAGSQVKQRRTSGAVLLFMFKLFDLSLQAPIISNSSFYTCMWCNTINSCSAVIYVYVVTVNAIFINPGHTFVIIILFRLVYDDARPFPWAGSSTIHWKPII